MVIDTSAFIVILFEEPEAKKFAELISQDLQRIVSAATLLEAMIVIEARKGETGGRELDLLLHHTKIDVIPFDYEQAELARQAWQKFGKGNHPAGLNYGDCFSYALAKQSGEPLLFNGNDFNKTDLKLVQY